MNPISNRTKKLVLALFVTSTIMFVIFAWYMHIHGEIVISKKKNPIGQTTFRWQLKTDVPNIDLKETEPEGAGLQ